MELPAPVQRLADELATLPGVEAVVLGGFAGQHARDGDVTASAGMLATATLCQAHARMAEGWTWVLNEKGLAARAELAGVAPLVAAGDAGGVAEALGVAPLLLR